MKAPRTLRESLAQVWLNLLDNTTAPQSWIVDGSKRIFDEATTLVVATVQAVATKTGATVIVMGTLLPPLIALLVALTRYYVNGANYYAALTKSVD